jgi:hypothetical protein
MSTDLDIAHHVAVSIDDWTSIVCTGVWIERHDEGFVRHDRRKNPLFPPIGRQDIGFVVRDRGDATVLWDRLPRDAQRVTPFQDYLWD